MLCAAVAAGDETGASRGTPLDGKVLEVEREAVRWLKAQIAPNHAVPSPVPVRRRLILSYRIPEDDPAYTYVYSRSYTYDDALAVVALTAAGEFREAEHVLGALKRNLRENGGLWFAYNTANTWPTEEDHQGAVVRTGAVAWAGYAATFYLRVRLREEEEFLRQDPFAREILEMAESTAGFILERQVLHPDDARYGLVTGGWAEYDLQVQAGAPEEVYLPSEVGWASAEHNIDVYFLLRDLFLLTGGRPYEQAAELVKEGLLGLWSEEHGQLFRGVRKNQRIDDSLPLDGASWAALFFLSIGEEEKARRCLAVIEERFISHADGIAGYKPYSGEPVYEDERVNSYYFPGDREKTWKDLDLVWVEGSLGVALAYIKAGDRKRGVEIVESMLPLRLEGGFRYASRDVSYQFSTYPSVASTAWFVLAVAVLTNEVVEAIFWQGG